MVMRECVRRWNRLPAAIAADEGKEFTGNQYRRFLADKHIEPVTRPSGEPRFGNPVERCFLTADTCVNLDLLGNNQNIRDVRMASRSHAPGNLATHAILGYERKLKDFFYKEYPDRWHGGIKCTPRERYEEGLRLSGARLHVEIEYDEALRFQTLVDVKRWGGRIDPRTGVHINDHDYWCDDFRTYGAVKRPGAGKPKYDPEDPTQIILPFGGRNLRCDLIGSQLSRLPADPEHRRHYLGERLVMARQTKESREAGYRGRAARVETLLREQQELADQDEADASRPITDQGSLNQVKLSKRLADLPKLKEGY